MGMPKKEGAWTFCRFKGGYLARKRELGFRGGLIRQCTVSVLTLGGKSWNRLGA